MIPERPRSYRIPYAKPVYGEEEKEAVIKSFEKGWLGIGEKVEEFEYEFANWHGRKYGVMVNSGSMANVLAVETIMNRRSDIKKFVTTPYSFPTTINHAVKMGLEPKFYDVDESLNIPDNIEMRNDQFYIFAHTMGNATTLADSIYKSKLQNFFIEDCCDAIGTTIDWKLVGTFGLMSTFSFYASHNLTAMGEGGMVLTDDEDCYKHLMSLRSWGRSEEFYKRNSELEKFKNINNYFERFVFTTSGYNCKPIEVQAAFALEQMKRLDGFINDRKRNYNYLEANLKSVSSFLFPVVYEKVDPIWFGFPILIKESDQYDSVFKRNQICKYLEEHNIEIRMLFGGNLLKHPYTKNWDSEDSFPMCDKIMNNGFFIGVGPHLSQDDLDYMVNVIKQFFRKGFKKK